MSTLCTPKQCGFEILDHQGDDNLLLQSLYSDMFLFVSPWLHVLKRIAERQLFCASLHGFEPATLNKWQDMVVSEGFISLVISSTYSCSHALTWQGRNASANSFLQL
jgi:hypothetical protein